MGQAAEGLTGKVELVDTENGQQLQRYTTSAQPSEPAALKDGEITDGEIEGTIRQLWEKWQFEGKVFYHEFEFALKEFTSLLTNHKS